MVSQCLLYLLYLSHFKSQAVKSASRTASFGQRHLLYSCRLRLGHMAGTPFHLSWLSSMKHRQFPCPDWTAGGFLHEGAVSCSHEVALYLLMDRFQLETLPAPWQKRLRDRGQNKKMTTNETLSGCKSGTSLLQCHLGWPFVKIWTDRETY